MTLAIPYMGTKRDFAPEIAKVIGSTRDGIVLDVFSGMCAIGQAVAPKRAIWSNDIQGFASAVATAIFTSKDSPPEISKVSPEIRHRYLQNQNALRHLYSDRLACEEGALVSCEISTLNDYLAESRHVGNDHELDLLRRDLATTPRKFPYCVFTITYSDGYFGLRQSIEIDSIRYAIDSSENDGTISSEHARWMLIALCQSILRVATTTGHFAQYLSANPNNQRSYFAKRNRSVWQTWSECLGELRPVGTTQWRAKNRAFNMDTVTLLQRLSMSKTKPDVVYADPPYTRDQYSRYYHVWETLIKYDYPSVKGKGRYRDDQFSSPFSTKSTVRWAFDELVRRTAGLGAELVLSYPNNGLLQEAGFDVIPILKEHYKKASVSWAFDHEHSTMGASKGPSKNGVLELVYWARQ